jgi:hypothetical protein
MGRYVAFITLLHSSNSVFHTAKKHRLCICHMVVLTFRTLQICRFVSMCLRLPMQCKTSLTNLIFPKCRVLSTISEALSRLRWRLVVVEPFTNHCGHHTCSICMALFIIGYADTHQYFDGSVVAVARHLCRPG